MQSPIQQWGYSPYYPQVNIPGNSYYTPPYTPRSSPVPNPYVQSPNQSPYVLVAAPAPIFIPPRPQYSYHHHIGRSRRSRKHRPYTSPRPIIPETYLSLVRRREEERPPPRRVRFLIPLSQRNLLADEFDPDDGETPLVRRNPRDQDFERYPRPMLSVSRPEYGTGSSFRQLRLNLGRFWRRMLPP